MQPTQPSFTSSLRRVAVGLGLAAACAGAVVLAGWWSGLAPLTVVVPGSEPVEASTALALVLAGLSIALQAAPGAGLATRRVGVALGAAVLVPSAATLLTRVGVPLPSPDEILAGSRDMGEMPTSAAAALLLVGAALVLLDLELRGGGRPAQYVALGAVLVPLQVAIAHLYGVDVPHQEAPSLSFSAGLAIAALCAAVLLARPEAGFTRVVASDGPAGFTARRLLVAIALLPVVLGWLILVAGPRTGQYEAMVGASLVVLSAVVTGAAVVLWNAREIQRMDEGRSVVEEALRAEREWFRTSLASIGDAVIAADESGRVAEMNAVAEGLTGWRPEDAQGEPLESIFSTRGRGGTPGESPFAHAFQRGRVAELSADTVLLARSGAEFPVEGCVAPIRDARGQPRGVVLVFRDIRERRRVEEERNLLLARERAARADAEAASRAKDEFIATLSHELRTPLNSVLGWARLLRMGKLDASGVARAVDAIERGASTQAQIVDDLLDVARIVRGQLRLDVRPVEMVPVVEAAIDTVRPAASARDIEIAAVLEPRAGPVAGDPGRLQQVTWNLLTNAVKFTPPGGRVEVRLARSGDLVELSVRDTGAGIPSEFLPHVFERFRQADSSTTRAHGGLGIGLAIVRHIVEAHGGTVSVSSDGPGLGSTFTVALPIAQQARSRPRELEPPRRTTAAPPEPARVTALRSLRVLIVDDDPDTLEVVQQLLEHAGAVVLSAASADEAFEAVRRARPDVLVSDIGMPGRDGYDLIRRVRALPPDEGGRVPAAALTAFAHADHRNQALEAGYQLYLAKPIEPAELTAAVARLAGRAV